MLTLSIAHAESHFHRDDRSGASGMRMPDVRPRKRCLTFGRTHRMQSNHRDQRMADAGFHLNPTARHSHGRNGLAGLAARRGFIERLCPRASLRAGGSGCRRLDRRPRAAGDCLRSVASPGMTGIEHGWTTPTDRPSASLIRSRRERSVASRSRSRNTAAERNSTGWQPTNTLLSASGS